MSIQRRNMPTIDSVSDKMQAFEVRYGISTDEFLGHGYAAHVNEDDAMQWRYLCEQLSALRAA